jgi:hypothetical protein
VFGTVKLTKPRAMGDRMDTRTKYPIHTPLEVRLEMVREVPGTPEAEGRRMGRGRVLGVLPGVKVTNTLMSAMGVVPPWLTPDSIFTTAGRRGMDRAEGTTGLGVTAAAESGGRVTKMLEPANRREATEKRTSYARPPDPTTGDMVQADRVLAKGVEDATLTKEGVTPATGHDVVTPTRKEVKLDIASTGRAAASEAEHGPRAGDEFSHHTRRTVGLAAAAQEREKQGGH